MSPRPAPTTRRPRTRHVAAAAALGVLVLTGCAEDPGAAPSDPQRIGVVTSTNVYADLVEQIGGDAVEVTPVIDSAAQDPHSYEASPQDRLGVGKADLVVVNGGGYDVFMDDLITDSQRVIDAVTVSGLQSERDQAAERDHPQDEHAGHTHEPGEFNEHVWYHLGTMQKLTETIATELSEIDPDHAATYTDNAASVREELSEVEDDLSSMDASGGYVSTEPMPGYLLAEAGLQDETPAEFTAAVDAESDVAPQVMKATEDLVTGGHAELLAFNRQTSTNQVQHLRESAQSAGVPVVEFSETLPDGASYQQWMRDNVDRVSRALEN